MGFFRNFKEVLQMEENRELTRAEIVEQDAKECFKQGLNCSECVMTAFLNHFDTGLPKEVVKLATGFGGGMGHTKKYLRRDYGCGYGAECHCGQRKSCGKGNGRRENYRIAAGHLSYCRQNGK